MGEPAENANGGVLLTRISTNALVRFLLLFACGWALLTLFSYFEYVITTFTFAAVLALLLNYPARYLERFIGRGASLAVVIVLSLILMVVVVAGLGVTIVGQVQQLANAIVNTFNSSADPLTRLEDFLTARRIRIDLEPVQQQATELARNTIGFILGSLPSFLGSYVTFIVIVVVAFFMLADGGRIWGLLIKFLPAAQRVRFSQSVQSNFAGFFQGQLLIALFLGTASFVVFTLLEIPFALVLALTVALFDLIPGIGATLGVGLVCLTVLVQGDWVATLKLFAACIALQQIQDNFIAPRVMQSTVNLNPVIVFFALLVGARIGGLIGVFLAVPVAGVVVSLLDVEEAQSKQT
jgi:predicted PurR-regulated permease PerM